jgi:hypothetical protein
MIFPDRFCAPRGGLRCLLVCPAAFMLVAAGLGLAAVGRAGESRPPNILFAIADDWGVHAGAYGTRWVRTPHFDRVARDGILFNNAYTPNAKCAPSRAAILTGRNSWQLKEAANHFCFFPPEFKGWAEALAEHGWTVGHTTKGWAPAWRRRRRQTPADDRPGLQRPARPAPYDRHRQFDYAGQLRRLPRRRPPGKPWAFWYGAIEPHRGYEFGSGVKKGGKKLADIERVPAFWPDNETVRTTCSTTPTRWSTSTPTSAACSPPSKNAASSPTRSWSSPPITACPSPAARAARTSIPTTCPSPPCGPPASPAAVASSTTTSASSTSPPPSSRSPASLGQRPAWPSRPAAA